MKTAEEILNKIEPNGELLDTTMAIEAMHLYALHVAEAVRQECAEKAKLSSRYCGDPMTCGCQGNCEDPIYSVDRKAILKVDINSFIK